MEKIEELINTIENQEKDKTRNDYFRYFRNWHWFVISVFAALAVALILYKSTPETYKVQSRLIIFAEENKISEELSFNEPRYNERSNISDEVGILSSYSVFRKAIENLNWKTSWYKSSFFSKTELYNAPFDVITQEDAVNLAGIPLKITILNDQEYLVAVNSKANINGVNQKISFKEKASFNKPFKNDYFHFSLSNRSGVTSENFSFVFNDESFLTSVYQKKVEITANPRESELVIVESQGEVPQKEADFLNELNKVFIEFDMDKRNRTSENSVQFIDEQTKEIKATLTKSEEEINNYRKTHGLMNLGQEANVIYTTLGDIESEKFDTEQKLEYYQNLKNIIGDPEKISQLSPPGFLQEQGNGLNEMLADLKDLYNRREVLALSVKEKSPDFVRLQNEIEITRSGIEESIGNLILNTQREKQNIDARYRNVQSRLSRLPESEKNLISMQRDYDVNNDLYNFLLQKKAEASITRASIAPQAKIIDPAQSAYAEKLGPKIIIFIFGGLFLGILIPFLFITISGFFNNKIESVNEIENASGIPVLDEIIHHKYKHPLPVFSHPRSGITESFRNLKVKVLNKIPEPGQKVISVNSMDSGEGKSFISANLAAALSLGNKKVLLVGTDLRNPSLHKTFEIHDGKGLGSYLNNEAEFDEIINPASSENLFFARSGEVPENPSELLESNRFEEFINTARDRFDYIVLDNAPLKLVPDANWTSRFSDIKLFTLRLNYSRKNEVYNINKHVSLTNLKNSFIVVNDTPMQAYGYGSRYWKRGYGKYNKKMRIA
ncbi:MAG: polysaccharide biosynthesis tyrosine autokinase [Prolixibacteraceae bacterium]|nr:polysaccharide biosynthesis tyrosine autokinase [Prolixibacteraceae bacterium]MBN2774883.1 polysaccharide biosynthesis tyrosine autokinase [Prolixibacteraceae bacterium]